MQVAKNLQIYLHLLACTCNKVKPAIEPSGWPDQARAYPTFCSMKWLAVFLLPPGWDDSQSQGYPQQYWNSPVPIYTPVWREALWEQSVLPKNTRQCPGQAWTQTVWSRVQCTNHCKATAPLATCDQKTIIMMITANTINYKWQWITELFSLVLYYLIFSFLYQRLYLVVFTNMTSLDSPAILNTQEE